MLAAFPFYSVMVGLRGTTNFSLLLPLVSELVLCQLLKGLVLSLFLIILSFWCYLPESPLLTFHFKVPSGSWPQLLTPYLFSFWLSLFLSFFPSGQNPFLLGWRFSSYFLFIVLPFGFSKIPPPCSWMATSRLLIPYCITGCLRRTYLSFIPCTFLVLPLSCLNPTSAVLCVLEILSL